MRNAGWEDSQTGIKVARRNINLRYADDTTLMAESEEKLKGLLMKEESEKVGLKLSISSVAQSCLTLCDPLDCSTLGFPVPSPTPRVYSNSCPSSQ